jgi:hypothetical protein
MRSVKQALRGSASLGVVICLLSACPQRRSGGSEAEEGVARCDLTARLPRGERRVHRLDGEKIVVEAVSCGARSRCYRGGAHELVRFVGSDQLQLELSDGARWERGAQDPEEGAWLHGVRELGGVVVGKRALLANEPSGGIRVWRTRGPPVDAPAPRLEEDEYLNNVFAAGDGLGISLARDDRVVPERRWLVPPTEPGWDGVLERRVVVVDSVPVGVLERAGSSWVVLPEGEAPLPAPVMAIEDDVGAARSRHPPLRFLVHDPDTTWIVQRGEAPIPTPRDRNNFVILAREGTYFVEKEEQRISRVTREGLVPWMGQSEGADLAGVPLPPGSVVDRVDVASSAAVMGQLMMLVRVRHPSCRAEDRILWLDVDKKEVRTVASGDRYRAHLIWSLGEFRWVESDVRYLFAGGS